MQTVYCKDGLVEGTSEATPGSLSERDNQGNSKFARARATTALVSEGGLQLGAVAKTAGYTTTEADFLVLCDASGGGFSVILEPVASANRRTLCIKNVGATGTVTVDANGAETIDGAGTVALAAQYDYLVLYCDGTSWHVIGGNV